MIVGTAGHIDHGKTALVRALTGVDPDRLPEEQARGITLDLGYAYHPLPNRTVLGFVDVPGHERLVHTMVAPARPTLTRYCWWWRLMMDLCRKPGNTSASWSCSDSAEAR